MKKYLHKKQAGVTLIELLLVIGISALIVVGGLAMFGKAGEKNKAGQMTREYGVLQSVVHDLWGNSPAYGAVGINMMPTIVKGSLPASMVSATASTVASPYGDITINVAAANTRQWVTTYPAGLNIPQEVCLSFVSSVIASVRSVTVAGVAVTTPTTAAVNCADGVAIVITSD